MMTTFRHAMLVALAASAALAAAAENGPWRVYIGTYTRGASEGIYLLELDPSTGALASLGLAAELENPSFLAVHPHQPVLYAVGELATGGTVSAFAINPDSGRLSLINAQSSGGPGPCHVAVAPDGAHLAVANYSGGSVALLPLTGEGALEEAAVVIQHEGASIHPRQQAPHAHAVVFDAAGRFLFAPDLGIDKVMIYRRFGTLSPNEPPHAGLAPGAGPRHFAFHPSGRIAYAVNELDNTVTAFMYDADAGALTTLHSASTLPPGFDEPTTTAEIRVHPSGRFLYASNRGHDSIAAFAIDPVSGRIEPLGHTPTGGRTPRNFNIDPEGQWLLAANQQTDSVVVFRIHADTGQLEPTPHRVEVPAPVCVLFTAP